MESAVARVMAARRKLRLIICMVDERMWATGYRLKSGFGKDLYGNCRSLVISVNKPR